MKKTEDFIHREKKKGPKQDLKAVYIKYILEKYWHTEYLYAGRIVELLEAEGIIVDSHYVSRIIRLLRDEFGIPIKGGNGQPYIIDYPNIIDETKHIIIKVSYLPYQHNAKKMWGEKKDFSLVINPTDLTFTVQFETTITSFLMDEILKLGSSVKSIEPAEVAETYRSHLRAQIEQI